MSTAVMTTKEQALERMKRYPAIITPSLPERGELLVEAAASVQQQTERCAHHVYFDHHHEGPAVIRNRVLDILPDECEHVGFLDDDDLIDADHVETLLAALDGDADLAFSWYRKEGATPETERLYEWDDYAHGVMLGGRNLIPVTVLARKDAVLDAGGFWPEDHAEDFGLWKRMLTNGCRFAVVPRETWTYRMMGGNRTWRSA